MAKAINKKKAKSVKVASVKKQIIKTLDTETTKAPGAVLLKPGLELECETCPVAPSYCDCAGHSPVTLIDPMGVGGFHRKSAEVTCRCTVQKVSRPDLHGDTVLSRQVTIKRIVSIFSVKYPFPVGDDPTMMQWGVNQANKTFIVSKELCDVNNP